MAFKLEDLISKKKEPTQILDLSKVKIKSKDDFDKYFDKIPEFKIRPEKVRPEDMKIRDTDFSFTYSKKEAKAKAKHEYSYGDPVPASMKSVRLEDLVAVDISWRMLTMARPKNKLEEDIFNRLVELGKLRLSTKRQEQEIQQSSGGVGGGPSTSSGGTSGGASSGNPVVPNNSPQALAQLGIIVTKNKRGVTEMRVKSCKECGEELCTGQWCKEFPYDSYTRMLLDKDELEKQEAEEKGGHARRISKATKGVATTSTAKTGKGKFKKRTGTGTGKNISKNLSTKVGLKNKSSIKGQQQQAGGVGTTIGLKSNKSKIKRKKKSKKSKGAGKTEKTSDESA